MDLIPEGKFPARAQVWKLSQTTKEPVKEQMVIEFKFTDANLGSILWFGYFTDAAFERTIESLRHCGWKGSDVLELDTPQADLNANEVELVIGHETYEGKTRARVKFVNGRGGVNITTPLAADKRAAFAQRMKANILMLDQGKPKTPKPSPAAPAGHPSNADIPF